MTNIKPKNRAEIKLTREGLQRVLDLAFVNMPSNSTISHVHYNGRTEILSIYIYGPDLQQVPEAQEAPTILLQRRKLDDDATYRWLKENNGN